MFIYYLTRLSFLICESEAILAQKCKQLLNCVNLYRARSGGEMGMVRNSASCIPKSRIDSKRRIRPPMEPPPTSDFESRYLTSHSTKCPRETSNRISLNYPYLISGISFRPNQKPFDEIQVSFKAHPMESL